MNERKTILIAFIVFILLSAVPFIVERLDRPKPDEKKPVNISEKEAISKVQEFCNNFDISCNGTPVVDRTFPIWFLSSKVKRYHPLHLFRDDTDAPYGLCVRFKNINTPNQKDMTEYFVVGGQSKAVEMYANPLIYYDQYHKHYSHELKKINWPEFMQEEKARSLVKSVASKLSIPPDMVYDHIEMDKHQGTWSAIWLRNKDGYLYEGDAISVTLMGASGEFVGYTKTYRGTPCPTEVKIDRAQAVDIGWKEFEKVLSWRISPRAKEIYRAHPVLMIVNLNQPDKRSGLTEDDVSRLSWVVQYIFSGGIVFESKIRKKDKNELTDEESQKIEQHISKKNTIWREMGEPPKLFEIRIDAATGQIIYVSRKPWYRRLFQ